MNTDRRRLCRVVSGLLLGGLGGCTRDGTETPANAANRSATTKTDRASTVALSGRIDQQADTDSPARVSVELQYSGPSEIELFVGPVAPFSQPVPQTTTRPYPILFDPELGPAGSDLTDENGCWRSPTEDLRVYSIANRVSLASGDTLQGTYAVVSTRGEGCVSDGEYVFRDTVTLSPSESELPLTVTLGFSSGRLSTVDAISGER